jgi:hypothetical protein
MRLTNRSGFALPITLVLMTLIVIVVVAYLASTRIERSTSSVYSNRQRAKITAESGLTAAIHLLRENTKYGNYITAVTSPASPQRYTEIYRPTDPASTTHAVLANDYVRVGNAAGEVLVSRNLAPTASPAPQVDPRPTPEVIPTPANGASFGLTTPNLTATDSYDFNQIIRVGNTAGRLVQPLPTSSPPTAFGQWINMRNSSGELIGRYAFFIEDESMKVNMNQAGDALGRVTDLATPAPAAPATQVQELDPAGVLASAVSRAGADTTLIGTGGVGSRIVTTGTLGLLTTWKDTLQDYTQMATVYSKDDLTTARGWQRLDLNTLVNNAGSNGAKVALAQKLSNWIRDAWTGPTAINDLQSYQIFGDERLRLQFAANLIDYIDRDQIPVDLGNYPNVGTPIDPTADPATTNGYPIIGIEKVPYLVEVDVVYTSTGSTPGQATIGVSFRFNFFNMFEKDLNLSDYIKTIRIKGIPVIVKNGGAVFNHEGDTFTIGVGSSSSSTSIPNGVVPWGGDNVANGVAGCKTFRSGTVLQEQVSFTPDPNNPTQFEAGQLYVDVYDNNGNRLDSMRIVLRDLQAKYLNAGSAGNDFLEAHQSAASINATYEGVVSSSGTVTPISFGDPRYRPTVQTKRFYNLTRTDTTRFNQTSSSGDDRAELDSRAYSVDWYDYIGNRPLAFHRDGPMLSVGELGNIATCEYPWRTIYLQYAGRPQNTNDATVTPQVQDRRGYTALTSNNPALIPQDFSLVDLFKTTTDNTRAGGLNINTQAVLPAAASIDYGALTSLFLAAPEGGGVPPYSASQPTGGGTPTPLSSPAAAYISAVVANRRIAVAPNLSGGPGLTSGGPPIYDNPRAPYFTIGQLASDMSWLINESENTTTTSGSPSRSRTTINYSILRATPTTKSSWTRNTGSDMQVEEPFRKVSNAITTRGNVFRVLYVGQCIKDINKDNAVSGPQEIQAEYLGEAIVERQSVFGPASAGPTPIPSNPDVVNTNDSYYKIVANRVITE